jgi:RHS repeat-associated protein
MPEHTSRCLPISADGRHFVGDPIDVVTGANHDVFFEFMIRGPVPFAWERRYDSRRSTLGCALGWGHAHSLEHVLKHDIDGLRYHGPLGHSAAFPALRRVGKTIAVDGWRLSRTDAARYLLRRPGHPALEFTFERGATRVGVTAVLAGRDRMRLHYDKTGLLERIETPDRVLFVEHDPAGRLTRILRTSRSGEQRSLIAYTYDREGNLVEGMDWYGQRFSFAYDVARRMIRKTDRRGYTFEWEYDDAGRCVHSRGQDGVHEVWLRYEPQSLRTIVRRGDGGEWTYIYDTDGAVRMVLDPCGGAREYVVKDGRVVEEIDGTGVSTKWLYDKAGAPIGKVSRGAFVPSDQNPVPTAAAMRLANRPVGWEWGGLARWLERYGDTPTNETLSALPAAVSEQLDVTAWRRDDETRQYDDSGRLIGTSVRDVWRRRFAYDHGGNVRRIVDGDNKSFTYDYESWDFWREAATANGPTLRMAWTSTEQLATAIDGGGTRIDYEYDRKDRLVSVTHHGTRYATYEYDAGDRVIALRDAAGVRLWTAERDKNGRVARVALASGDEHTFAYDDAGRPVATTSPDASTAGAWSSDGVRLIDLQDGLGAEHTFENGMLVETKALGAFTVGYGRNGAHERVVRDPRGVEHRIRRLGTDVVVRTLGSGTSELAQYRQDGRCVARSVWTASGNRSAFTQRYTYTAEGDLVEARQGRAIVRYAYDDAHRLVAADPPDGTRQMYAHDGAGNLVRQPGLDGVTIEAGNRIVQANGDVFTYDARFRVASRHGERGTTTYAYDELDMLRAISGPDLEWSAGYDALRRRVWKTVNGRTTRFRWDGDRLIAELRDDGSVRVYVYVDTAALTPLMFLEYAGIDAAPRGGRAFYVHVDHRATPTMVTHQGGLIAWRARIAPYGQAHVEPGAAVEMPLRFPGHYHDAETGLHYNRYRYYSPELGRYLQPDPSGQAGGTNVYAYSTNPLKRVDVRGLCEKTQPNAAPPSDEEPTLVNHVPPQEPEPEGPVRVDPRVLVDDAINGGAIVIQGDPAFHAGVRSDLENMAGTPSGAATINRVMDNHDEHGTTVTITPMRPNDHPEYGGGGPHCEWSGGDPRVGPHGEDGTPTNSTIRYTPGDDRPAPQSQGGSPSDATLNHEMNHAANNGAGENMTNHPPGDPRNGNAEEGNVIQADNQYREERGGAANGYPPRDGWDHLP